MSASMSAVEVRGPSVSGVPRCSLTIRPGLDDLESVHLRCAACGETQTWVLQADAPLRAAVSRLACCSCGVVGDLERAPR